MKNTIARMGCVALLGAGLVGCVPLSDHHSANWTAPGATSAAGTASASPFTTSQQQAIDKAESYLDMSGFSKSGLIKQLEYEKFSATDATFAVQQLESSGKVDWNQQAVRKAQSYLEMSSFSMDGLIKQLQYEGFTPTQAQHGAQMAYH
jgi:hypothetical protein